MLILGIDHGSRCTGWGLVDVNVVDGSLTYTYKGCGRIITPTTLKYPYSIKYIGSEIRDILARTRPDYVALEAPKDNRGFKTTQILTELLGAIKYILMCSGYPFTEIPPSTMKKAVTGHGWSTKEEVAIAVANELGIDLESIVGIVRYKTGEKAGQIKEYILDGSDSLGLSMSFITYLKSKNGEIDFDPKH